MMIYMKITLAILMSAGLIETNGFYGHSGYGQFVMAFVYAAILLAGAFFIVSAVEKYVRRQKIRSYRKSLRERNLSKPTRHYQPLYQRMRIVR